MVVRSTFVWMRKMIAIRVTEYGRRRRGNGILPCHGLSAKTSQNFQRRPSLARGLTTNSHGLQFPQMV